ncbi:transmembrane protein 163-like isoform X2 [Myripristis murdjan]|uniref:transmembrane protein 163-like isoform X2 n=1 Tax=Myripristis murdjan TaxID=586833 RepID=UPI00117646C7|nr:transmembrane protein 163-like isoform X2 [Myripristis murdjan]
MTDSTPPDPAAVPDPAVVDPTAVNGQCEQSDPQQQQPKTESQGQALKMDQEMKITDSIEDQGLLESSMRLKPHEAQSYRKKALWVSWASIVVTIILAIAAFTVSIMRHSASAFGFAFDATLDVLSSIIVLWRYSNAAAVHSAHREYIACAILGVIFILSSLCILGKAIHDLATKLLPEVLADLIREDIFSFAVTLCWSAESLQFKPGWGPVVPELKVITEQMGRLWPSTSASAKTKVTGAGTCPNMHWAESREKPWTGHQSIQD